MALGIKYRQTDHQEPMRKKATPMKIRARDLWAVHGVFVLWGLLWQHIDKEQRISRCSRAGKVKIEEFTSGKGLVAHD